MSLNPTENLLAPFDAGKDSCGVGFVANLKNKKSHEIVEQGIEILLNLAHRGACGCETNTGDGAGIVIQISDKFFRKVTAKWGVQLPKEGEYGVGFVFLPQDSDQAKTCEDIVSKIVGEEGQTLLGWRLVPTDNSPVGPTARACEPIMKQVFVGKGAGLKDADAFERKLFLIRKRIENTVRLTASVTQRDLFYVP
ncbi:MAG TPA: glutamate synthase subunit alpha, partial [bacterium]